MARIAGVDLPARKHVTIALRYIYGIGPAKAKLICTETGVPENKKAEDLTEAEVKRIREFLDANVRVEGDLRRDIAMDIKRQTNARWISALTADSVIARACRFAVSAPRPTPVPARGRVAAPPAVRRVGEFDKSWQIPKPVRRRRRRM
jgi:ribosomal protein uS13